MTAILNNSRERSRFMRFALVGVFGAIVDFGTFNLLTGIFKMPAVLASVCSFGAAIVSNFIWNRYWTYPDSRSKRVSRQMIQFAVISVIGLLIRTPLFAMLEAPLSDLFASLHIPVLSTANPNFIGHNLALAIAVGVVMFWNFFVNRYWTYGDVE
jgi:putative flippase GtrA